MREAAEAARAAPPGPDPPRAVDVLLDAFALRLTEGHAAAAPALTGPRAVLALDLGTGRVGRWLRLAGGRVSQIVALELWDVESWHALADSPGPVRPRRRARWCTCSSRSTILARAHILAGDLAAAALLIDEDRLIAEATGNPPVAHTAVMLAAWRGREPAASELIEATVREATARGLGRLADFAAYASRCSYNGLGRHEPRATPRGGIRARPSWLRALCRPRAGRGGGQDR